MWSRNQRQTAVRIFLRRIRLLGLLILAGSAASGVWGVYLKERESAALRAQAERQRQDLLTRQEKLEADIVVLKTDQGVEETLRKQYALAGEGEKLIIIVDPPRPATTTASSTVGEWLRRTFWWW